MMSKLQITMEVVGAVLLVLSLMGFAADNYGWNDKTNSWTFIVALALIIEGIWL